MNDVLVVYCREDVLTNRHLLLFDLWPDVNNECFFFRIGDVAVGVKVSFLPFPCCTFDKSPGSASLMSYSVIDQKLLVEMNVFFYFSSVRLVPSQFSTLDNFNSVGKCILVISL